MVLVLWIVYEISRRAPFPLLQLFRTSDQIRYKTWWNIKTKSWRRSKRCIICYSTRHDIAYQSIQDQYKRDNNKQRALSAVRKTDNTFIKEAYKSNVQPLGKISAGFIKAKRNRRGNRFIKHEDVFRARREIAY